MEQLEEAWVKGDIKYIDEYFSYLDLLIKKITGIIKTGRRINITISFPPALSFDIILRKKKSFIQFFLKILFHMGYKEENFNVTIKLNSTYQRRKKQRICGRWKVGKEPVCPEMKNRKNLQRTHRSGKQTKYGSQWLDLVQHWCFF